MGTNTSIRRKQRSDLDSGVGTGRSGGEFTGDVGGQSVDAPFDPWVSWADEVEQADTTCLEAELNLSCADDDPAPFQFDRIESLLGTQFYLDPERTVALPKINSSDNVQQVTRKIMGYIAKTQDLSDLDDAQIARLAGFEPWTGDVDADVERRTRRSCGISPDDRLVPAVGSNGRIAFLSVQSNSTKHGYCSYTAELYNAAQRIALGRFEQDFTELHPELDPRAVRSLFRHLEAGSSGWDHREIWDESRYGAEVGQLALAGMLVAGGPEAAAEITEAHEWAEKMCGVGGYQAKYVDALTARKPARAAHQALKRAMQEAREMALEKVLGHRTSDEITEFLSHVEREMRTYRRYKDGALDAGQVEYYSAKIGDVGSISMRVDSVAEEVGGTSYRSKVAATNRAYRQFIEGTLDLEYDFTLQRKYVRDHDGAHRASVFEDKKNIPQTHLDAAAASTFKTSGDFRHVEVDQSVDLDKFAKVADEWRRLSPALPHTRAPGLGLRKTGNHRAIGVYAPSLDHMAVDPRHPGSFIHEYIHHIDHTVGDRNLSSSDEFKSIRQGAQANIRDCGKDAFGGRYDYAQTPTEIMSRSAELYFHWRGLDTSLNGGTGDYETSPLYVTLRPLKEDILAFWDARIDLGKISG